MRGEIGLAEKRRTAMRSKYRHETLYSSILKTVVRSDATRPAAIGRKRISKRRRRSLIVPELAIAELEVNAGIMAGSAGE
jgi:hypothetical protein